MIVVFGRPGDPPIDLLLQALQDRGAGYQFVDDRHLGHAGMALDLQGATVGGRLVSAGMSTDLSDITAVYVRLLNTVVPPDPQQALHVHAFQALFTQWLDLAPALVVSRPRAMASNSSKPYQAQLIASAGFEVPETLVTNDPREVAGFRARHPRIIFKSVNGVRSIVTEFGPRHEERLGLLRHLPTQFQAAVPGTDVRVHVVGSRTFATEVASQAVDYRYAARTGTDAVLKAIELDGGIHSSCVRLAASLELPLCGIDLRRTPEGRWVCFEANPMPAFSYYEAHTDADISGALAMLLMAAGDPAGARWHHGPGN